jgi:hypothetical protein
MEKSYQEMDVYFPKEGSKVHTTGISKIILIVGIDKCKIFERLDISNYNLGKFVAKNELTLQ